MRVYDCVTFNGEWDVLRIRVEELNDVVDQFVLVEGTHTFQGTEKPRHYGSEAMPSWVQNVEDRIVHWTEDLSPECLPMSTWDAEETQRNAIKKALFRSTVRDDDLVLISDVDEIPRASVVRKLADTGIDDDVVRLGNRSYYYALDLLVPWQHFYFPTICRASKVIAKSPQSIRVDTPDASVPDAGWHFSCLGGAEAIKRKLTEFAHDEYRDLPFETIEAAVREHVDFLGRGALVPTVIDESYPEFVQANKDTILRHLTREGMGT